MFDIVKVEKLAFFFRANIFYLTLSKNASNEVPAKLYSQLKLFLLLKVGALL